MVAGDSISPYDWTTDTGEDAWSEFSSAFLQLRNLEEIAITLAADNWLDYASYDADFDPADRTYPRTCYCRCAPIQLCEMLQAGKLERVRFLLEFDAFFSLQGFWDRCSYVRLALMNKDGTPPDFERRVMTERFRIEQQPPPEGFHHGHTVERGVFMTVGGIGHDWRT